MGEDGGTAPPHCPAWPLHFARSITYNARSHYSLNSLGFCDGIGSRFFAASRVLNNMQAQSRVGQAQALPNLHTSKQAIAGRCLAQRQQHSAAAAATTSSRQAVSCVERSTKSVSVRAVAAPDLDTALTTAPRGPHWAVSRARLTLLCMLLIFG